MKSWLRLFALVSLLLTTALPALANLAPPNTPKPKKSHVVSARMRIGPDSEATEAKLIIPREVFRQLKAELDGGVDSEAAAAAGTQRFNLTPTQTAFAGLCLSLSFVFAGVWFAGSRLAGKRVPRSAAALAAVAVGCAAATAVYANAGPPPVARSLTSRILIPEATYYGASGEVKVEIVEGGSPLIQLVLPKGKEAKTGDE